MKRILLMHLVALFGQFLVPSASAQSKPAAIFTAHTVDPVILSPRSTVILGYSTILSPVDFAFGGVLVGQRGEVSGVFNEAIIQDGDGNILGTGSVLNSEGQFVVKFNKPYAVFANVPTDIVVLGRTKDDLGFANTKMAGLQTNQFFYNGTMVEVQGQYPGGELRVDTSVYQRARVVLNRETPQQTEVIFKPNYYGTLRTIDRFIVDVEFESGVKVWPMLEIITTGNGNPRNIRVALSYGAGKTMNGIVRYSTEKNRAFVDFPQPLMLPTGKNSIEVKARMYGSSFLGKKSAVFIFNTDQMQAEGNDSGYPVRVLSDLSPASNAVVSQKMTYFK